MVGTRTVGGSVLAIGVLLALAGGLSRLYGMDAGVPTIYKLLVPMATPVAIVGVILIIVGIVLVWRGGGK